MTFTSTLASTLTLLLTPITVILTAILNFLPHRISLRIYAQRDLTTSLFRVACGRLLPRLHLPHQDLTGKTAIVTGGNSGIGLQMASDLARMGATVVLACRDLSKARTAVTTITYRIPAAVGRVRAAQLDTSSFDSVRAFASAWSELPAAQRQIDVLCHNAGIASPPAGGSDLTSDGVEIIYATNVLGSFALTHFLEPCLADTARVVFTTSTAQYTAKYSNAFGEGPVRGVVEPGFHCPVGRVPVLGWEFARSDAASRYGNSKGMQCVLAKMLQVKWDRELMRDGRSDDGGRRAGRLAVRGRVAHAFTPNFTMTPIFGKIEVQSLWRDPEWALLKATTAFALDVDQGAATGSWLASTEDERVVGFGNGGGYWDRMSRKLSSADLLDETTLDRLWARWEKDSGLDWR